MATTPSTLPEVLAAHRLAYKLVREGGSTSLISVLKRLGSEALTVQWYRPTALRNTSRWEWTREQRTDLATVVAWFGLAGWSSQIPQR